MSDWNRNHYREGKARLCECGMVWSSVAHVDRIAVDHREARYEAMSRGGQAALFQRSLAESEQERRQLQQRMYEAMRREC